MGWVGAQKAGTKEKRWYKDIGLGYKTPGEAITGTYIGQSLGRNIPKSLVFYNAICRQEVPIYWRSLYSWTYLDRTSRFDQDEPNDHHSSRLPPLYSKIPYVHWYPCTCHSNPLIIDRYEKRHKNLAAHVSPAFRVELGDVVTVGAS